MSDRHHSPFDELLVLARKVKAHYFNPKEEERISILIRVIMFSGLVAIIIAMLNGLPAHIEKGLDPRGNSDGLFTLKSYIDTFMILFCFHMGVFAIAIGIASILGLFPFKRNWDISMRIKWLGLWIMTLWGIVLIMFVFTWENWDVF